MASQPPETVQGGRPLADATGGETPARQAAGRRVNWLNLPSEVAASLLAITTVPISLPPGNLPPWAIFVSWSGTFAAGGPKAEVVKKVLPAMPVGSITAFAIVELFNLAAKGLSGPWFILAQMGILGVLNGAQIALGRFIPAVSFVPGLFFGFASFFATYFGGFGLHPHVATSALWATIAMNAWGVLYAWLNVKLMRPGDH